ncbi:MAG TPA: hemerythrin domain-containing protein [Mycobacteriales bacterium]|nr:hemerythrin domain-containing protein [Mycobacteriales bacterium]
MGHDAIEFLLGQHQQVEKLIEAIKTASADNRGALFDELREMLAVHETAEELVLRPVTKSAGADGKRIAEERIAEENEAKRALADLEKLDPASETFLAEFGAFASDVVEHATNEEQQEFPLVRRENDSDRLSKLGTAMQRVEKVAPTHPHPSAKSAAVTLAVGPFASLLDRARDAISAAVKD